MKDFLAQLPTLALQSKKQNQKYFQLLKKRTPKNLDYIMQDLHEQEFEKTDCLTCANCCKTTSPIFTKKDIEKIAKYLKMKILDFQNQYLKRDEDDFMVLKSAPCSFLNLENNECTIYNVRPKACAEYPHTNRRKFIQITDLTIANTTICPATFRIVENLKKQLPFDLKKK